MTYPVAPIHSAIFTNNLPSLNSLNPLSVTREGIQVSGLYL
jgi:hypothetical protein